MAHPQPHQPPAETTRKLRRLVEARRRARNADQQALDELHAAVYQASLQGASDRGIAAATGVSANTIRSWRKAGEQQLHQNPPNG